MAVLDESALTKKPEEITIGFTGDVMLARGVENQHSDNSSRALWGDLVPRLRSLDALCINLECCLSNRGTRQPDRTYYFRTSPDWSIPALREIGVTFASLANNHVLDYGEEALIDTTRFLKEAGIHHAGAGKKALEARRPATFSVNGLNIAVLAFTDNAASYSASEDTAGTWHINIGAESARKSVRKILRDGVKPRTDIIIASVHWGPNWVTGPAQRYREFTHWLVENGVDVVHGHSAHVFQGVEIYDGQPILHDCGDFVDDYVIKPELRNDRCFLFELSVTAMGPTSLRLRPVEIRDQTVFSADEDAAEWARSTMKERSSTFGTSFERDGNGLHVSL